MTLPQPRASEEKTTRILAGGLFLVVLLATVVVRLRLLYMPLERDEGEYAYVGCLLLNGGVPYLDAANMKWPGIYAAYAMIMALFGEHAAGIHFGLLLCTTASSVLVYRIGNRLSRFPVGAFAGAFHAVLALSPLQYGLAGHATNFVTVAALAGFDLLLQRPSRRRVLLAGTCFGMAALMKQPGIFFAASAVLWCLYRRQRTGCRTALSVVRDIPMLILGILLPLGATALIIYLSGAWDAFVLWTVRYAIEYSSICTPLDFMERFVSWAALTFSYSTGLNVLSALGGGALLLQRTKRRACVPVALFSIAAIAAATSGWACRLHYLVPAMPGIALTAAFGVQVLQRAVGRLRTSLARWTHAVIALLALAEPIFGWWSLYFVLSPEDANTAIYSDYQPFVQSVPIGEYLRARCSPSGKIAILGSEPQIAFYAQRPLATRFLYIYPLVERTASAPGFVRTFLDDFTRSQPDYVVLVFSRFSWCLDNTSDIRFMDTINQSLRQHYELERIVPLGISAAPFPSSPSVEDQPTLAPDSAYMNQLRQGGYIAILRRADLPGKP